MCCLCKIAGHILKWLMVVINVAFVVVGIIFIALGTWLLVDPEALDIAWLSSSNPDYLSWQWIAATCTIITVGSIIFIIGIFGCIGLMCENSCLLVTYEIIAVICIIGEILAGCFALGMYYYVDSDNMLENMIEQTETYYNKPGYDYITRAWDDVQVKKTCCGAYNYTEYSRNQYVSTPVAWSCCYMTNTDTVDKGNILNETICYADAGSNVPASGYYHSRGCGREISDLMSMLCVWVIGITFGLLVIQLFGVIVSCCVRNNKDDGQLV